MEKLESVFLYDNISNFIQENNFEISSITENCFSIPPQSLEFLENSIELTGLLSSNLWLTENSYCGSINELKEAMDAFNKIINHPKMAEIEKNMEIACFTHLYLEDADQYMSKFISLMYDNRINLDQNIEELETTYYSKALIGIDELLSDPEIIELEKKCHFVLYGNMDKSNWNCVDYYKVHKANHECYKNLQLLLQRLEFQKQMSTKKRR